MKTAMARHILLPTKDQAQAIKKQLQQGSDFAKLAKKHSTCNSGNRGGDLGEIRRGQLVKPVEKAIFTGPVNTVQGPVKSQFGFHLIDVYFRD